VSRVVYCVKLQTKAQGLNHVPYFGELGQKIYESISAAAWQQWVDRQTMLINEQRLSTADPKAQEFLEQEMKKFLFGGGESTVPAGFVPPRQVN